MDSFNSVMDPELWGNLKYHISLDNVFLKLPLRDFFQLRGVCKDWNRLACEKRCLTDRIRKPYFVIAYPTIGSYRAYHIGILTFNIASGQWKWNRLSFGSTQLNPQYQPFSVKGLVFGVCTTASTYDVFDVRTKRSRGYIHEVPSSIGIRALGMAVDTSVMPHTFKIIVGGLNTKTLIYDSATDNWETRSSVLLAAPSERWAIKSCVHCEDHVYIWSQMQAIQMYSLKDDIWSTLNPPAQQHVNDRVAGALGYWDGRVFSVMNDGGSSLCVWELVDRAEQVWRKFDCMPGEVHGWLVPHGDESSRVFANFCDEHVLFHTLLGKGVGRTGLSEKFVLFNLVTKRWEKLDIGIYGLEPRYR